MRTIAAALVLCAATVSCASAADELYLDEVTIDGVLVRRLANAGVWIAAGDDVVVIDGLYEGTTSGRSYRYANLAEEERSAARTASARWAEVDVLLVTHQHFDHFEPSIVAEHMRSNPGARFVGTNQAADRVRREPGMVADRIVGLDPATDGGRVIEVGKVRVWVLDLPHGGSWRGSIENVGYVVELAGVRILHVGDADTDRERFAAAARWLAELDLFLAPGWYFLEGDGPRILDDVAAERVVGVHLAPGGDRSVERAVHGRRPEARLFERP